MTQLHVVPGGVVYVRTNASEYSDTVANFAIDLGQALPALPPGADERLYIPGVRHTLNGGGNVIAAGPMPFPVGDAAIAGIIAMLASQTARNVPPSPTPQEIAAQERAAVYAAGCAIISAGAHPAVTATWALDQTTQFQISQLAVGALQFGLPGGAPSYPYPDAGGTPHDLNVIDYGVLYSTLRDYIAAVEQTYATKVQGGPASWPAQPVNVA